MYSGVRSVYSTRFASSTNSNQSNPVGNRKTQERVVMLCFLQGMFAQVPPIEQFCIDSHLVSTWPKKQRGHHPHVLN